MMMSSSPGFPTPGRLLLEDQIEQLHAKLHFQHLQQQQQQLQGSESELPISADGPSGDVGQYPEDGTVHFDDCSSERSWHSQRSEEDEERFRKRRQAHYNEYQVRHT